jgi:integrase
VILMDRLGLELREHRLAARFGQGHDPVFVSRQLGHANPAITLRVYAHLLDGQRHAERARALLDREFQHMLD